MTELLQNAIAFATRAHAGQLRKDGITPYISHPLRVAFTVAELFQCHDQHVLSAAVLHDTIEDTTKDFDDLVDAFGSEVAKIVAALTKDSRLPEREREEQYFNKLKEANWKVRLVKLADAYDNLCDSKTSAEPTKATKKAKLALGLAFGNEPTIKLAKAALRQKLKI